jgi:hypothetical protein
MRVRLPTKEATMSILGGLVDRHHEMELSPSSRLIRANWFARHVGAIIVVVGFAIALFFLTGAPLR